jgi:uncharacterized protein (TIGR02588 family)
VTHSGKTRGADEVSRYEWIVGAVGALIFLFLVTYFIRQAVMPAAPVRIEAQIDSIGAPHAGEYIAYFTAWNRGRSSAAEVRVTATLHLASDSVSADATIARIAAGSRQSGAFLFLHDPGRGQVRVRVVSYQTP